ncbi:SIR2 family protein [Verminephrobacter aporrectodeae]|uniref:SIR2 family protein n=1 Tax=Verminephrobacter aporrectodeae TaxID=1110389 RepID=UPI002236F42D|nr:SIR2 family protein [Verminephrobacter aporrectodeae]
MAFLLSLQAGESQAHQQLSTLLRILSQTGRRMKTPIVRLHMTNPMTLKNIAVELTQNLRRFVTVAWTKCGTVWARLRGMEKTRPRRYKHPSDRQGAATQTVLPQGESAVRKVDDSMSTTHKCRPDQRIKDAAKHGKLVVFVGAGASRLCGSPDWRGFANQVVGELEKFGELSFLESEQLRGLGDPRRILSIALALAKEKKLDIDFNRILHPSTPEAIGRELYELLAELRPVFVTTNYDKWLDDEPLEELAVKAPKAKGSESEPVKLPERRQKYYLPEHLSADRLVERGAVIHLHGTYTDPDSMVVSLRDYIGHYANETVKKFLSEMFKNYTVLFVGYGLAELEILEQIIRSNESLRSDVREVCHYILYACRSTASVQTQFIENFFREQCGVKVIPYCIDEKGYPELLEVFKSWMPELDVRDPTLLDQHACLDRYVKEQDTKAALGFVQKKSELSAYFLNSLKDAIWFKELDEHGFFKVEHSPKVKTVKNDQGIEYEEAEEWPALCYLERIAPSVEGNLATRVADIVRAIDSDAQQRKLDNWRTWWSLATIMSQLPLEVLTAEDIEMARPWLLSRFGSTLMELGKKLLPRLLDSADPAHGKKAMLLVDVLTTLRASEEKWEGARRSYCLGEVLKPSAKKLGERCGVSAVQMLAQRLAECIGKPEDDRHLDIWRPAIEEHEQNGDKHKDSFRTVLVDAVRDAALGAMTRTADAAAVVKTFLDSPYPILVRVGIYLCGEHYENAGSVFWNCVKPNWFLEEAYRHELFWFIKKAFTKFSTGERSQFLALVGDHIKDDRVNRSREKSREERWEERWDERRCRDLLHPAVGLGDAEVDSKYKALVERWEPVREHPDFLSFRSPKQITGVRIGDRSPVEPDALIGMSAVELLASFKDFVPEPGTRDGPTYRDFSFALSAAVRASEDGFSSRIQLFENVARPYQHGLLRGLKERWSDDKRDIDWSGTLSLLQSIVSAPSFRTDLDTEHTEGWEPSVHWVVSDIAELMAAATDAERPIDLELYGKGLDILQRVLEAISPTAASDSNNAVSDATNSPRGRALESVFKLALAMRRQEVVADKVWEKIGPLFKSELASSESGGNADFAALAGLYCVNLHYLNPQWVEQNFDRVFSLSNDAAWRCAAQGFVYQGNLYEWLFQKLTDGGHLKRMVYAEGLSDKVARRAQEFLGLAYIEGWEKLDSDSLLDELIASLQVEALSHLSGIWTRERGDGPSPHTPLVLAFWKKIAEQIRQSGRKLPKLQSALVHLTIFIDDLRSPEVVQLLKDAAPHADVEHKGFILIEHLACLAPSYPKEVAAIFCAALSGFLPVSREEDVIRCVTGLADAGQGDEAEGICNAYAGRGSTLLKETYQVVRAKQWQQAQNDSAADSA